MSNLKYLSLCTLLSGLIFLLNSSHTIAIVKNEETIPVQNTVESVLDGKWIINHPDSHKIYAVQCGLDVTIFALKYFKIEYSLPRVSMELPFLYWTSWSDRDLF
jgi:hypothetical protein